MTIMFVLEFIFFLLCFLKIAHLIKILVSLLTTTDPKESFLFYNVFFKNYKKGRWVILLYIKTKGTLIFPGQTCLI